MRLILAHLVDQFSLNQLIALPIESAQRLEAVTLRAGPTLARWPIRQNGYRLDGEGNRHTSILVRHDLERLVPADALHLGHELAVGPHLHRDIERQRKVLRLLQT